MSRPTMADQANRRKTDIELRVDGVVVARAEIDHAALGAWLARAIVAPDLPVRERDPGALAAAGVTARWFADECRAGRIRDAVRTPGAGWTAPASAVRERLAERRRPRHRAQASAPVIPIAPAPDACDLDRQLLAQAGRARRVG